MTRPQPEEIERIRQRWTSQGGPDSTSLVIRDIHVVFSELAWQAARIRELEGLVERLSKPYFPEDDG